MASTSLAIGLALTACAVFPRVAMAIDLSRFYGHIHVKRSGKYNFFQFTHFFNYIHRLVRGMVQSVRGLADVRKILGSNSGWRVFRIETNLEI